MSISLTEEQKEALGIKDGRKDFYFKVENAIIDGYNATEKTAKGKEKTITASYFDDIYEKMIFIVLCRYCNNNEVAYPSFQKIADMAMCSRRKAIDCIESLENKGFIKKVSRPKTSGDNDTNLYTIQNIREYTSKEKEKKESKKPSAYDALPSAQHAPPSAQHAPNKEQEKKNNLKRTKKEIMKHEGMTFFENLFKELEINFTATNQKSVIGLLKSMSQEEVKAYLVETYTNLKANPEIKNLKAAFSSKIQKGERQPKYTKKEVEVTHPKDSDKKESHNAEKDEKIAKGELNQALAYIEGGYKTIPEAFEMFSKNCEKIKINSVNIFLHYEKLFWNAVRK